MSSGVSVGQDSALSIPAVFAAVRLIAGDVGSLPLLTYRRLPGGGKGRDDAHPLFRLLHDEPNPEMSALVFRETLQAHVLTWGNGYAEIERDGLDRPIALWPIPANVIEPYRAASRAPLTYRYTRPDGGVIDFPKQDILHIPGLGFDGVRGYSVIQKARESLGLAVAAERFGSTFFGNGSTFGGVLKHPGVMTAEAKKDLKESIRAQHQGVDRAHRFILLQEGLSYERLGVNPEDAQSLETRKFQITEIARWFNLPPHKLADLERATFSNIEQQSLEYVTGCLRPWLIKWEQELTRKLLHTDERSRLLIEHSVEGLLRGDSAGRAAYYQTMTGIGAMSVNEVRRLENLPPVPGGDVLRIPTNTEPLQARSNA